MRKTLLGLTLMIFAAVTTNGCTVSGPEEETPDGETPVAESINSGYARMLSEQIVFKGGRGYIRTIPWSSDPQYDGAGGYVWSQATGFRDLPNSWYKNLPTSPAVSGFTAFAVGETLHEYVWLGQNGYKRTRNALTGEANDWVFDRTSTSVDSSCSEVTAYAVSRHGDTLVEGVWCGSNGRARYLDTKMNEAAGSYEVLSEGPWFEMTTADLPFPPGAATSSPVVQNQGFVVKMDGAVATKTCDGKDVSIYGYLRQAWWHSDDTGFYRDVPLDAASLPLWSCAGATSKMTLAQLDSITPEFDSGSIDAGSNHRLYDIPDEDAPGVHRYELRATRYNISDLTVGYADHHIGLEVVHLVNGRRVWGKRFYNHGRTINSNHYTVLAQHELGVADPQKDITEAEKLAYMRRCVDYMPNGYCASACGNDGYTLPPIAIAEGITGSSSRPDEFTPKQHFSHDIYLSRTQVPMPLSQGLHYYDVPRYGHNSNNDAEAEYQHFLQCDFNDYGTGASRYQQIADDICSEQCDGYADAPGSTTPTNIALPTMPSCGSCATVSSATDDDLASAAHARSDAYREQTVARQNPCAGNHRHGAFHNSCRRVHGM